MNESTQAAPAAAPMPAQTTAIQKTSARPIDTLRDLLEKARPSMALVVPRHVTPERLVKLALVAASRTPLLLQCDPKTIVQGVMTAAQLGLDCGGVLGSAYLIPFKNKSGKYEAQLIVGYRGLIDLARRSGEIETIEAHVVHVNDTFEVAFGLEPILKHVPCLSGEAGPVVIVYAIARLKDGGRQVEVMTKSDVDRIRARSRAGQSGPWVTDYDEMARKTVVRRLCKYLPLSPELAEALTIEDKGEKPGAAHLEVVDDDPENGAEVKALEASPSKAEQLAQKLAKGGKQEPAATPAREPGDDQEDEPEAEGA